MIAKNIKGKSFGGCVRYVMNKGSELLEAEGVFGDDPQSVIKGFAMQRAGRPEILQPVGHIPLSFSAEDSPRLTNDFLIQLAGEYMREMGIENTQYVIVRHHNTAHDHIHIIYNRIDNDLKLISVNHDYQRNVKTCKKLKDRHGLTYGEGKEKVNVKKLANPDKAKYKIYDALKDVLPCCVGYPDLEDLLGDYNITVQYKYRRGAVESAENIQGVSFYKDGIAFKGSEVDRQFSHANLQKAFEETKIANDAETQATSVSVTDLANFDMSKYVPDSPETVVPKQESAPVTPTPEPAVKVPAKPAFDMSKYIDDPLPAAKPEVQKPPVAEKPAPAKPVTPIPLEPLVPRNPRIYGVELTNEQVAKLKSGDYIRLENMRDKDGSIFSAYVFTDDQMKGVFISQRQPDEFVKYGKYEMRAMDRSLINKGFVVRATVKWYGNGNYARPYLWKENPADTEYKESWDDPRKSKQAQAEVPQQLQSEQKPDHTEVRKPWRPAPPKKKSGIKM